MRNLKTLFIALLPFFLFQTTGMSSEVRSEAIKKLDEEAKTLKTDGTITRYHDLLENPFHIGLQSNGFIIGIEKSPKQAIRYPNKFNKGFDTERLRLWRLSDQPEASKHLKARNEQLQNILDDPKAMFVSHIIKYSVNTQSQSQVKPTLVYSSYKNTGFPATDAHPKCGFTKPETRHYDSGWRALDCLENMISEQLSAAKKSKPYTHIIVASMGWNNDQIESIARYNAIIGHTKAYADIPFKPLVLGITWPSVWGGKSFFNSLNRISHITSYGNKANDADDIGYTIANHLINAVLPRLQESNDFQTVIIGHSFGARVLSRALLSGHLLNKKAGIAKKDLKRSLFIGLQPAFSVRRFYKNNKIIAPVRPFHSGEGAPYTLFDTVNTSIVMTTSEHDDANPLARFLTGAAHVGGKNGLEIAQMKLQDVIKVIKTPNSSFNNKACVEMNASKKVTLVDASSFIKDHNDMQDAEIGDFLWGVISCFDKLTQK